MGETTVAIDTLRVVPAACLVFFMNAGFAIAMLQTGFCRSKDV